MALVGPVGSGKTSLLQGFIGEMRKTSGNITFGGSVGYCPQSAWIQVGVRFFYSEWLINYFYRMRLLKRIFVLDVLLNLRDTGRPSVARVIEMFPYGYLTEVGRSGRGCEFFSYHELWDMELTAFSIPISGYLTLQWSEAAAEHLSYHLLGY